MAPLRVAGYVGRLVALSCATLAAISSTHGAIDVPQPDQIAAEISLGTTEPLVELEAAVRCFRKRDFEGCWKLLTAASAKHRELPPPRVMLAQFFLLHNQLLPAHLALEQAAAEHDGYPGVYISFGKLALIEKRMTDALVHFTHARRLADGNSLPERLISRFKAQACEGLASVASSRENWAQAETYLKEWLTLSPSSSEARVRLAHVLFTTKRPDDAYEELQLAAKDNPLAELPSVAMAWLYARSGDREKASQWMERSVRESPEDARSHLGMATWLTQQREYRRGRQEVELALKIDPGSYNARLFFAFLARSEEDHVSAEECLQSLHKERPDDLTVSCQLVLALADQTEESKRSAALELAEANLMSYPSSATVLTTTGWANFRTARLAKAEELLQQALSHDPSQPQAAYYLACVLAAQGRPQEAKPLLEKILTGSKTIVLRPKVEALVSYQPLASPFTAILAAASMEVASDGSSKRRLIRSRRYAYALTPSIFAVWTSVVKMSIERAPRTLRLCRLTSRRRALTRAWSSDALLCNGTPGTDSTVNSSSLFAAVFAMRSSNAA